METNEAVIDTPEAGSSKPKKPVFLLVLCILTFVGKGLGFFGAFVTLFTIGTLTETMGAFGSLADSPEALEAYVGWTKTSVVFSVVGTSLCIVGAILMLKLKKVGYYLYIPGQIIPFIGSILMMNAMTDLMENAPGMDSEILSTIGSAGIGIGAIFPIAFIIMYGLNLKHMK